MSKEQPSVHPIANLAAALALFEPVYLVNEKTGAPTDKWGGLYQPINVHKPYPTIHELLNTCYAAMGAMKEFIKEVDTLRNAHAKLTADALQAYTAMKGERLNPGSLIEGVETLIGQKHQCFDVMDKITSITLDAGSSKEQIYEVITKFRNRHPKVEKSPKPETMYKDGDGNILSFDPDMGSEPPTNGNGEAIQPES